MHANAGLALPYMDHAALLSLGSVSRRDRSRLEHRLASKASIRLASEIAEIGMSTQIHVSVFESLAHRIAELDERVAAPLWQQLEHRFICMAENDIDVCSEAKKHVLLEKFIDLSRCSLPSEVHSRVVAELTNIVNRSFGDSDAICIALMKIFEECRELPLQNRAFPLRNLLLSLPFSLSDALRPKVKQLVAAVQDELPHFSQDQQASITHDIVEGNVSMEEFFATFATIKALPLPEHQAAMSELVGRMLTLEHDYADATVAYVLRFFSSLPHLPYAEMLTALVPTMGQISNQQNCAARLRSIIQLARGFAAEKRVALSNAIVDVTMQLSLPANDRQRILSSLYRNVLDMNPRDKLETIKHINALAATLPAGYFTQSTFTLPDAIQRLVRIIKNTA